MQIKIISFGQIAAITGNDQFMLEATDIDQLRIELLEKYPELKCKKFAIAVNKQLINTNMPLHQNDIVALLPPFSGG